MRTLGMRHVALNVTDPQKTAAFYVRAMGMTIEWQPDADNIYLTTAGLDNLAIHKGDPGESEHQQLHHIGFAVGDPDDVDAWLERMLMLDVKIAGPLKAHRDGARSFYVRDPDGVLVQIIYHPPIADRAKR
jgi:catechol 2,3-dioxygenase-like lactoylglutathione lyase family enzyme